MLADNVSMFQMRQNYEIDQIAEIITNSVVNLEFPKLLRDHSLYDFSNRNLDKDYISSSFYLLKKMSNRKMNFNLGNGFGSMISTCKEYIDIDDSLIDVVMKYFSDEIMRCRIFDSKCPTQIWNDPTELKNFLKFSLEKRNLSKIDLNIIFELLKDYSAYKPFRPSAILCLYEMFKTEKVLDLSFGFGEKLISSIFYKNKKSDLFYVSAEPIQQKFSKYIEIINEFCPNLSKKDKEKIILNNVNSCEMDKQFKYIKSNCLFDAVFVSLPGFDMEYYPIINKDQFKDWYEDQFLKSLEIAFNSLKENGNIIITIPDIYRNFNINKIYKKMHNFMENVLVGCKFKKIIAYRKDKDDEIINGKINVDPIFIYTKISMKNEK